MSWNPSWANAIASIESQGSGGYSAVGPTTQKGNRAYGKYQVMDFNIPTWTEKHLGKRLTPDQFLQSPEAQEAVFKGEFGSYVSKYGNPQDAASVWFTGRPQSEGANRSDVLGTTGSGYVNKFNNALGTGATSTGGQPMMQPEQKPKGLLGGLFSDPDKRARLAMALEGMTLNPNQGMMASLQGGIDQRGKDRKEAAAEAKKLAQTNKSLEFLASQPGGEDYVRLAEAAGVPTAMKAYLESKKAPKSTDDIIEYKQALSDGFKGSFIEYKQALASSGSSSSFGEKVSTYKNAYPEASDAEILEMIKDPTKMPAAYQSLVLRAKDAGLEPGTPKYEDFMRTGGVGDATFSREEAKLRSEGLANLPIDIETSKQALDVLDLALSDDYRAGLNKFVGPLDAYLPNISGAAKRFRAVHNQIKGKTFMEAYKTLKGGGQITEVEGKKATEAQARLDNAQNEEDYIEALRELRGIIQKQYMRSQSKLNEFKGGQSASGWRRLNEN
jgi:hypothetical protein